MMVIKAAPSPKEPIVQEDLGPATPCSSNFVTAGFSKCVGGVGTVLVFAVRSFAMLILQIWLLVEVLLSLVMGPAEWFVMLVTNPHGVAMFWIIIEVFFEVGVSVVLAGVSVFMSAILLLEDVFKGSDEDNPGDASTKSLLKKVRAKVFASQRQFRA